MSLRVDPYKLWFNIVKNTFRVISGVYPLVVITFYCSLELFFLGMLDLSAIKMLFTFLRYRLWWYLYYWQYLSAEDHIGYILFILDKFTLVVRLVCRVVWLSKLVIKNNVLLITFMLSDFVFWLSSIRFIGDFFLGLALILGFFLKRIRIYIFFCFFVVMDIVMSGLRLFYLFFEDIFYNFFVAHAIYIFSEAEYSGGIKLFSILRALKIFSRNLSWGGYGYTFTQRFNEEA